MVFEETLLCNVSYIVSMWDHSVASMKTLAPTFKRNEGIYVSIELRNQYRHIENHINLEKLCFHQGLIITSQLNAWKLFFLVQLPSFLNKKSLGLFSLSPKPKRRLSGKKSCEFVLAGELRSVSEMDLIWAPVFASSYSAQLCSTKDSLCTGVCLALYNEDPSPQKNTTLVPTAKPNSLCANWSIGLLVKIFSFIGQHTQKTNK